MARLSLYLVEAPSPDEEDHEFREAVVAATSATAAVRAARSLKNAFGLVFSRQPLCVIRLGPFEPETELRSGQIRWKHGRSLVLAVTTE